jgi:hypothetical protein
VLEPQPWQSYEKNRRVSEVLIGFHLADCRNWMCGYVFLLLKQQNKNLLGLLDKRTGFSM